MKFIGIDIGTTHTKVIIYDAEIGEIIAKQVEDTPVEQDKFGFVHDPVKIRDIVFRLLKKSVQEVDSSDIAGISCASVGEEVVLFDSDGRSVGVTPTWYDSRGKEEAESFFKTVDESVYHVSVDASFSLFKLLWLRSHRTEEWQKARSFTDLGSYILGCLSGVFSMDWSHASRTACFDITEHCWIDEILQATDIASSIEFPQLVPSGTVLGSIRENVSRELGIPRSALIVAGGHDHLCGAYASGVRNSGEVFISAGTSEAQLILTSQPIQSINSQYSIHQGCFVDDQHYYVMSSLPSGHVFQQWTNLLYPNLDESQMYEEVAPASAGTQGVKFILSNDLRSGTLFNLPYKANRGVILRAVLEGLAFHSSEITEILTKSVGVSCKGITVTGHPTRSEFWKNLRSGVSGKPLYIVEEKETAALGAALLAMKKRTSFLTRSLWEVPADDSYKKLLDLYREKGC